MTLVLALLDWTLTVVHLLVVLGNVLLWIPRSFRKLHLCLVAATAASWLGLGLFYGLGYCVLTDWHWAVKRARGETSLPHSFIHHLLVDGLGLPMSSGQVDQLAAVVFATVALLSLALNLGPWLTEAYRAHSRRSSR